VMTARPGLDSGHAIGRELMSDLIKIFGGKFNAEPRPVELLDVLCLR